MKNRKTQLLTVMMLFICLITSCSGAKNPTDIVKDFNLIMGKGESDKAAQYIAPDLREDWKKMNITSLDKGISDKTGMKVNVKDIVERDEGENKIVECTKEISMLGMTTASKHKYTLSRIDGKWYIVNEQIIY